MRFKNNMLRLFCITMFLGLVIHHQGIAQTSNKVGVKGGLNVSNLYINDVHDENARLGFHAGIYGQLFSSTAFALQAELLYSTKGTMAKYDGNQEVKYNLNYLDLPLLGVFKIGETVEIHAGGYVSYLLDANISYKGDLVNGTDAIDKENLKSYDYGLALGVGINIGMIQVGSRYNYGLVTLADSNAAKVLLGDSKNSCAQLFLAFNLGRN